MSGFSYPQPFFRSPIYNPAFYLSLDASGYLTYDYAQTLYLGKNDYRLTYITGITPGTATPGVALVIGCDGGLSGLGAVSCSSLTVNGSSIVSAPAYVQSITPGTAANSKALVLDSSGAIGTIVSLTATNIYGTLQTAAQSNITSLGTLIGLTIGGNLSLSGASRVLSLTGSNNYIDSVGFRQGGVAYDLSLIPRLSLTTLGTAEASKAIVLNANRSCSNIYGMTFDSAGTGLDIPALSFGGIVFNQNYYLSLTEGSAGVSKALITNSSRDIGGLRNLSCTGAFTASTSIASPTITTDALKLSSTTSYIQLNNTTSDSSSTTGAIRCLGGIYAGASCFFQTAITCTDLYGLVRTPNQFNITGLGTLTSLSTSGKINCGRLLNGYLGYGDQSNITTVGKLKELAIGSTAATTEYIRVTGNGLDYLDGSYARFMRFVGSNATPVQLVIEASNGTSATASNAVFIGTSSPNDIRFGTNNSSTMALTTTNRLGVGTLSPSCGLQVTTNVSTTLDASGSGISYFLRNGGLVITLGPISGVAMAIQATGAVVTSAGFYATSDARRKNFFDTLNRDKIMAGLLSATPKLYRFKTQSESVPLMIGYSAQELIKNSIGGVISYIPNESLVIEDPTVDLLATEFNVDYSRMACYVHIGVIQLNDKVVSLTTQLAAANAKLLIMRLVKRS